MNPSKAAFSVLLAIVLPATVLAQSATWTSGTYAYDGRGNIVRIGADQYVYDQAGRLTSGTANGIGHRQAYAYDSFGNRVSMSRCADGECIEAPLSVTNGTNHLADGTTYGEAGNVESTAIAGAAVSFTTDATGMPSAATGGGANVEYIYTADDERIAVHAGSGWTWSVRDLDHRVARDFSSRDGAAANWNAAEDYVYTPSGLAGSFSPFGRRYLHLDHLGTPRLVTGDDGRQLGQHLYFGFGEALPLRSESPGERMKFAGHESDLLVAGVDGLDYMHARYYDAARGRFAAADPNVDTSRNSFEPQRWNRYTYVANNPLGNRDADGRDLYSTTGQATLLEIAGPAAPAVTFDSAGKMSTFSLTGPSITVSDYVNNEGAALLVDVDRDQHVYSYEETSTISTAAGTQPVDRGVANLDHIPLPNGPRPAAWTPAAGVDDAVAVNPQVKHSPVGNNSQVIPQRALAFHELAEAFAKMQSGKLAGAGPHQEARRREIKEQQQFPFFTHYLAGDPLMLHQP